MVQETTTSKTSCGSVYRERAVDVGGDCGIRRKAQERGSIDGEGGSQCRKRALYWYNEALEFFT